MAVASPDSYGRKDAHYQHVLVWWNADRVLTPEAHPARDRPRKEPFRRVPSARLCADRYNLT